MQSDVSVGALLQAGGAGAGAAEGEWACVAVSSGTAAAEEAAAAVKEEERYMEREVHKDPHLPAPSSCVLRVRSCSHLLLLLTPAVHAPSPSGGLRAADRPGATRL